MAKAKTKKRRTFSPAQIAAQERFKEMVRQRAGKVGSAIKRSASFGRGPTGGQGMLAGIAATAIGGTMDGVWIVAGKVVSRAAPALLKMDASDPAKFATVAAVQVGAGLGASMAANRFISRDAGRLVFAGTVVGLLETLARKFQVPYVSTLVGDEGDVLGGQGYTYEIVDGGPARMGMYPGGGPGTGMGLYPGSEVGSYVYE